MKYTGGGSMALIISVFTFHLTAYYINGVCKHICTVDSTSISHISVHYTWVFTVLYFKLTSRPLLFMVTPQILPCTQFIVLGNFLKQKDPLL